MSALVLGTVLQALTTKAVRTHGGALCVRSAGGKQRLVFHILRLRQAATHSRPCLKARKIRTSSDELPRLLYRRRV